jgi:ATP-dependent DNA helicase RecG
MKSKASSTNKHLTLKSSSLELAATKRIPKTLQSLYDAGLTTIEDLLWILPLRIQPAPKLESFKTMTLDQLFLGSGKILSVKAQPLFFRKSRSKVMLSNITATVQDTKSPNIITLKWFNAYPNQKKLVETLETFNFMGVITEYRGSFQIINPKINPDNISGEGMIIEYPTINKVSGAQIEKYISKIPYSVWNDAVETLPDETIKARNLPSLSKTFQVLHGKVQSTAEEITQAKNRLVYEEFFHDQLKIIARRNISEHTESFTLVDSQNMFEKVSSHLPYELTTDQRTVIGEIKDDLTQGHPMMRIVQGDVGCGKTTVAIIACALFVKESYQAALMCPTEALAKQHLKSFFFLEEVFNIKVELLLGSHKASEKKKIYERLESGDIDILVGTHSLIQENVVFKKLGLAIIDEQHKFGVAQRQKLIKKGKGTHCLIMTATPIPRTLQLAQFGDLNISTIKSIPSGRKGIKTRVIKPDKYENYLSFIKTRVSIGEQVYVVVPAIEESETLDIKNVDERLKQYKMYFPDFTIEALHGKLKPDEKTKILNDFNEGKIQILISTSVIEVGINVPNATVMSIYNPERFGLSSLHQLRGRVGRGSKPGFCFLNLDRQVSSEIMKRLKVVESSTDGFVIAEADLRNRGEGDLFGFEQSGAISTKKVANISLHLDIFQQAYEDVKSILNKKPQVIQPIINKYQQDINITSTI